MLFIMYIIWLFVIYCVAFRALVGSGKFDAEILAPAIASFILATGGIRPFVQSVTFIILYLFMIFFLFALDIYTQKKNQN